MTLKHWLFILFIFCLPLSLRAQQYEAMRIAKIDVVLENPSKEASTSVNAVRAKLCSKVGNFFSQIEFDRDLKTLAEEYARVEPSIEVINSEIHITIHLWQKPKIREIIFEGNERISSRKLQKTLEIESGATFERSEFVNSFNKLKALYVKKGYFEAELDYQILPVRGEDNLVDIRITVQEGRAGKIKEIRFEGLTRQEEDALLELIVTRKYQFLLSWYTGRGNYHPEMIEHDRLQIIDFLQNQGYADAVVDLAIEESEKTDRIYLVIRVDKGIRYQFGDVCFVGNTIFPNDAIWEKILFRSGWTFSPERLRDTIKAISDLYGREGYIDVNVDAQLSLRENCPIYDVVITIEEGLQYYVGLIRVFGNRCTHTNIILHESLLCPGEVFDNCRLDATEVRLVNTGYFKSVNVYAVRSQLGDTSGGRNYRDIYIEVEECDTGSLGLFGGFSSLDRIFGGIEITERNFNIAGIPKVFQCGPRALRGAGEFAHAKINIGDRQTSYLIQWTKPYFLDTPWILGVELEKTSNRAISHAYNIKTYGGSVHGIYIVNPFFKYDIYYRARHTSVSLRDKSNPELIEQADKDGFISVLGLALVYDSTDHPRRPCCGLRSRIVGELAGIGGNFQFMKFAYLNSYYYPICKRGTLKFRGDVQFIKTYASTRPRDVPFSERFFLGGEGTVRGYKNYIIGPKFGNNEPTGGVSSLLISEEYQHNLLAAPCLDGFVFIDAGYVSLREFKLGKPAAAVGFGIRIEVMRNIPIELGLGWPIHPIQRVNNLKFDNSQRFFFTMGGCF